MTILRLLKLLYKGSNFFLKKLIKLVDLYITVLYNGVNKLREGANMMRKVDIFDTVTAAYDEAMLIAFNGKLEF